MIKRELLILGLLLPVLAACASDDDKKAKKPTQCPQVAIVRELERIDDYGAEKSNPNEFVGTATMQSIDGSCEYDRKGVDVTFDLSFLAAKGPRLGGNLLGFPYFASVVDPAGKVIGKELMTANFKFADDQKAITKTESLHVFIPTAKWADASDYRVLLGFQLTQDQLDVSRKLLEEKQAAPTAP